jgi:hypothetical protein
MVDEEYPTVVDCGVAEWVCRPIMAAKYQGSELYRSSRWAAESFRAIEVGAAHVKLNDHRLKSRWLGCAAESRLKRRSRKLAPVIVAAALLHPAIATEQPSGAARP